MEVGACTALGLGLVAAVSWGLVWAVWELVEACGSMLLELNASLSDIGMAKCKINHYLHKSTTLFLLALIAHDEYCN